MANQTTWLNVNKENTYTSAKRPYTKKDGAGNWGIHVSVEELTFWSEGPQLYILAYLENEPSGVAINNENKEKIKWPMPFRICISSESDSLAEKALHKALTTGYEEGKFYSGFYALKDGEKATKMYVEGKDSSGNDINEKNLNFLTSQICSLLEVPQDKLTQEIVEAIKKDKETNGKGSYGSRSESTVERYNARLELLKTLMSLPAETTPLDLVTHFDKLEASTQVLFMGLIK